MISAPFAARPPKGDLGGRAAKGTNLDLTFPDQMTYKGAGGSENKKIGKYSCILKL